MRMDLISVVVPIYNVEPWLKRCVDTIVNQTYKNLEIILVDDGSTDNSGNICDELKLQDSRIKVLHKSNGGLSDARNAGIKIATGKYITFVDSDDCVELDMIEYLYDLLATFNTRMSLCTHSVFLDKSKKFIKFGDGGKEKLASRSCIERMLYHDVIDTTACAKLYDLCLFEDVEFPKGKLFEDIGTIYKLFIKSKYIACGYVSKYNYFIRLNSITTSNFSLRKLDLLEMTDNMGNDVLKVFPYLEKAVLRRRVYARFSTLNQMLDCSNHENIKKEIIDFILENKINILSDIKVPIRDKVAVFSLYIGFWFYKLCWKFYKINL